MPMLKLRLLEPQCLIDLNRVAGLSEIRQRNGLLCLGAIVRHADVATSDLVRRWYPLLADAARVIGDPQIRNRGTVGGSLVHADPAGDYPTAMLALNARLVLSKVNGSERTVPAGDFFLGPMMSAIEDDELLTEIRLAKPPEHSGGAYIKHSIVAGDFALISVGVQLSLDRKGRCQQAVIAVGGLPSKPACAAKAARVLVGSSMDEATCVRAAQMAAQEVEAGSDVRASETYRKSLIRSSVPAMIRRAKERAEK